jgi:NADPH:quinone reductase-like Zn-dependent oxidoreductase
MLVAMGTVSGNEYMLGEEAAGVIRRIGSNVDAYKIGDRVAVLASGCLANRIQVPVKKAHPIPPTLSFEVCN